MSKHGLAIAEPGDSDEDDERAVGKLQNALKHPMSEMQSKALTVLAREAGGNGRRKAKR